VTSTTVKLDHPDKAPITVDDLAAWVLDLKQAGIPGTAELVGRVRVRGSRVTRLEVTG